MILSCAAHRHTCLPPCDRQCGLFVAFSFTKDAEDECAAFFKRTKRVIKLLTVKEILDEEFVQKM